MQTPSRPVLSWFFRRRLAWFPTVWGWLALLILAACLAWVYTHQAGRWLSANEPARSRDGHGASTLVVEGWVGPEDLDRALQAYRQGHYQRVVTTGGPNYEWPMRDGANNYAERAAEYLLHEGMPAERLFVVPAPASAQNRTFLSGVMVRDWAARTGTRLDAIDVFSVGPHTRRSRMLYRMAFGPSVAVGSIASRPTEYDVGHWWSSSAGVKAVIGETLSIAWTVCCFWPPAAGSPEERSGRPPAPITGLPGPATSQAPRP